MDREKILEETRTYDEILADLRELLGDNEIAKFERTNFGFHVWRYDGLQVFCNHNMNKRTGWFTHYKETRFGWILTRKVERKAKLTFFCNKKLQCSECFGGEFESTDFGFVFFSGGCKKLCDKNRDMICSTWFTGGWKIREDGTIVYWDKPVEQVF